MRTALFLTAIGALFCRLVPHPPNAVPMGALAIYAGACLPRRWAWLVPVLVMALSDFVIDSVLGRPLLDVSRWIIYATIAGTTLLGPLAKRTKVGPLLLPALSLSASGIFFITSNFGAWLTPAMNYPRTLSGLTTAYVAGIPFFQNTVLAVCRHCGTLRPGCVSQSCRESPFRPSSGSCAGRDAAGWVRHRAWPSCSSASDRPRKLGKRFTQAPASSTSRSPIADRSVGLIFPSGVTSRLNCGPIFL